MKKQTPTKNKYNYFYSDHTDHEILFVKEDLCLVSSVVSYEDPYESIYQYMIEETIH